jgi:hypothetical protein
MIDIRVLRSVLELTRYYTFSIAEFAGGCHESNSSHYAGRAFDVNVIDGRGVRIEHPKCQSFMNDCCALGAARVLGPPNGGKGHATHIHAERATAGSYYPRGMTMTA